jgi:hypothetical protein
LLNTFFFFFFCVRVCMHCFLSAVLEDLLKYEWGLFVRLALQIDGHYQLLEDIWFPLT